MFSAEKYIVVTSLDEAYELNQQRGSTVLGGCGWLSRGNRKMRTAIDLSALGLDWITETETTFEIGAMTSLRTMETNDALRAQFGHCIAECVHSIVGVQFRNIATVGGSIWARFGFSDVLTCFLALDARVRLHHAGEIALRDFVGMQPDRDILTTVILPKNGTKVKILSHRRQSTDLPTLVVAVARDAHGHYGTAVGARPFAAQWIADEQGILFGDLDTQYAEHYSDWVTNKMRFDSNLRGTADYRAHLCRVLVRRAVLQLEEELA